MIIKEFSRKLWNVSTTICLGSIKQFHITPCPSNTRCPWYIVGSLPTDLMFHNVYTY